MEATVDILLEIVKYWIYKHKSEPIYFLYYYLLLFVRLSQDSL